MSKVVEVSTVNLVTGPQPQRTSYGPMGVIVPLRRRQPSSPIQTTRSPDASLRASAVFMIPNDGCREGLDRIGGNARERHGLFRCGALGAARFAAYRSETRCLLRNNRPRDWFRPMPAARRYAQNQRAPLTSRVSDECCANSRAAKERWAARRYVFMNAVPVRSASHHECLRPMAIREPPSHTDGPLRL